MTATETTPQEPQMHAEPRQEHHWLQKLVGEWTYEGECLTEPGKAPMKFTGTESVRSLGGLWVVAEGHGEMPGCGPSTSIMTLGYDPKKGRYVGTWVGSMIDFMWHYDGALDAAERVLTLDSDGPSMTDVGQIAKYRDVIEFKSDDHRVLSSQMLGDDGSWTQFMEMHLRRNK